MPSEQIRRRLAHDAGHMFDLVADIERYPEFLPGCREIAILGCESGQPPQVMTAEMKIGHRLISERFTCQVVLDRSRLAIDVDFIDGPFTELTNAWRFHQLGEGASEVEFTIDFTLKSRHLGLIVATLFDRVFMRFADAFETRADQLAIGTFKRRPEPA